MNGLNTETVFQNLFELLSRTKTLDANGAPTNTAAFLTTSRTTPQVSAVSPEIQPAMFVMQGPQDITEHDKPLRLGLVRQELTAAIIILFRVDSQAGVTPSTVLNHLRDAVMYQMTQATLDANDFTKVVPLLGGSRQTLGGVVYHARFVGKIDLNEGLANQQGGVIFPVSILHGL